MITLGIEGTAHTLGVGIVDSEHHILSNDINMFHPNNGGLHPREVANHHADVVSSVISSALKHAGMSPKNIDLISFSMGPGLGPCLRVAATAARAFSYQMNIPIIGVNHCIAHIEIGRALTGCIDPILLYVSGGNTQIIAFSNGRYRIFGETQDIGIGNMFDKLGRKLGMGFYAGPIFEKLATHGSKYHELPYSVKGMDVSFSGIMTAAIDLKRRGIPLEDIALSIQETTFAMLTEVTERAMAYTNKKEVLLGGGVAQNKRLRDMVMNMTYNRCAKMFVPDCEFCVDNGAMIALVGNDMYKSGTRMDIKDTAIKQKFRTDEVDVTWRH